MALNNDELLGKLPEHELRLLRRLRITFYIQLVVELAVICICATLPVMTDLADFGDTNMLAVLFALSLTLVASNLADEVIESAHHRRYHRL